MSQENIEVVGGGSGGGPASMGTASRRLDGDTLEPVTDLIAAADRIVVRDAWRGTGQGPDADMEFSRVFTLRERKIIDVDIFWDHADALEAVGLRK